MTLLVVLGALILLLALASLFWKTGAVGRAETPGTFVERPVTDEAARRAFRRRLDRWRADGKIELAEYEAFVRLAEEEWDADSR